jgi:hypothetical protein
VDPSGGGADEFAYAIGHTEDGRTVRIDVEGGRARAVGEPVQLTAAVAEIAAALRRYRVVTVKGDKYAGDWVAQEFIKHGIAYQAAEKNKSQLYREAKPFFNEDRVEMPRDPVLIGQLGGLEERVRPGGRVPTVDHAPGGHDDRAVAVCGVVAELAASMAPAVGGTRESFAAAEQAASGALGVDPASAAMWAELQTGRPPRGAMHFRGRGPARPRLTMFR